MEDFHSAIASRLTSLTSVAEVLLRNFNFKTIIQEVVDRVLIELLAFDKKYKIVVLSLTDESKSNLQRISITLTDEAKIALKTTEVDFHKIVIPMNAKENLAIRALHEKKEFYTNEMWDILRPVLTQENADIIQAATGIKSSLVFPVIVGGEAIGTMFFSIDQLYESVLEEEKALIRSLITIVGISIQNSSLFEEREAYQEQLVKALGDLQEARRKERDMIDVMGHELRTPISIVRNALAMLDREYKKSGEIPKDRLTKYLDMGLESARREITLIETLLSATKVDASRLQLYLVKVDFKDVVNDALEGQRGPLEGKDLKIVYEPPKDEIFVYSDRTRVQEVMDNFLSNAIKYTPSGSVTIKVWKENDLGWVSIQDTGMGIDEADLQNLGKKFFRAKQYIKDEEGGTKVVRPGGTGLGLYVTFELIRVMGGSLYINSKVGEGTRFTFSMPIYANQEDKQIDQTFEGNASPKNRTHIVINGDVPEGK